MTRKGTKRRPAPEQDRMIAEALRGVGRPVSAYELIDKLRAKATFAPQTVYRSLDRLIAEDLLFTGPDGQLGTKAQDLAAHQSGVLRIRGHEPTELRVRRIGTDVAIVALRTRLVVEVNGATIHGTYRYTRVWAREQGDWRVAGGHVAASPSDDSPPP